MKLGPTHKNPSTPTRSLYEGKKPMKIWRKDVFQDKQSGIRIKLEKQMLDRRCIRGGS